MKTLTEAEIQRAYIDDTFADGNADQERLRREERGRAYQKWLRERTVSRTHTPPLDGDAA